MARGAAATIVANQRASRVAHPSPRKRTVVAGRTTDKSKLPHNERNLEVGPLAHMSASGLMATSPQAAFWRY